MPPSELPLSVYVHVPFCVEACPYCNFNFRLLRSFETSFVDRLIEALLQEAEQRRAEFSGPIDLQTLYFGGGTPSVLSPAQVRHLIEKLSAIFSKAPREITFEANPEHLRPDLLAGWRAAGVNRLSLGVQSFDEKLLETLGRAHSAEDVRLAMAEARRAGFENISVDLIAGVPGETLAMLCHDLQAVMALQPEHVSYYGLTIEEKTAYYERRRRGELALPDEETQAQMFEAVRDGLRAAGFQHYEISNFARPGFESLHNSGYWLFRDYIGLGPGAHSFQRMHAHSVRKMNLREPRAYVEGVEQKRSAFEAVEQLDERTAMGEFVFTGLRRLEGFSAERFESVFHERVEAIFADALGKLVKHGLLERTTDGWRLTKQGVLLSDSVFEAFV